MEDEVYKPEETPAEQGVDIPLEALSSEILTLLIKDFILREGTDYGFSEVSLKTKMDQVQRQLEKGLLKVVFDLTTETGSIVPTKKREILI